MVLTGLVRRNGAGDTRVLGRLGGTRCPRGGSRLLRRDGSSGESGWASCWGAGLLGTHGRTDGSRRLPSRDGTRGLLGVLGRVDRRRWLLRRNGARGLLRVDRRADWSRRLSRRNRARGLLGVDRRIDRSRRLLRRTWARRLHRVDRRVDRSGGLFGRAGTRGLRRVHGVKNLRWDNRARRNLAGTGSRNSERRGIDRLVPDQGD
jgi:hypothetical protein